MIKLSDITFTTEYVTKSNENYYFMAREMNAVCSINIQRQKMEVIGSIPEEDLFSERLFIKLVYWNEKLIFIPMNGKKVWFFCLIERKWHSLCLKNAEIQRKFRQAFIYKDKLFMIGCHYPAIVCVDLRTEELQYIDAPYKAVQDIYEKVNGFGYFRHDCVIKGNLLYFASFITNKILIFNLDNFNWKYISVGSIEDGFSGIVWDGSSFWLSPCSKSTVFKWDGEKLFEEYPLPYQENNKSLFFNGVVLWNGDIIFPAQDAENTIVFHNANSENYELIKEQYLFYTLCDSGEIICGKANGEVTMLFKNGVRHNIICSISVSELSEKLNITSGDFLRAKFSGIVHENEKLELNDLLAYIDIANKNLE